MSNKLIYNDLKVVSGYARSSYLFKSEKIIFESFKAELSKAYVADIGVGGGRTTAYLRDKCLRYIGVDYSEAMIKACRDRFPDLSFYVHDAAQMERLADASFDFVLFSFNGIDCVGLEHRDRILKEVYRILKPGGKFIFSFHNALSIDRLYSYQIPKNPFNWIREYQRVAQLKSINGAASRYKALDFFVIKDGAEDFKTDVVYVKPSFQIDMLANQKFKVLKILEVESGQSIPHDKIDQANCFWIYLVTEKI